MLNIYKYIILYYNAKSSDDKEKRRLPMNSFDKELKFSCTAVEAVFICVGVTTLDKVEGFDAFNNEVETLIRYLWCEIPAEVRGKVANIKDLIERVEYWLGGANN